MSPRHYHIHEIIEFIGCDEDFVELVESKELVEGRKSLNTGEKLFPEDQVDRIRVIKVLMDELEVNLAGVEVIMEMRENMIRMQTMFDQVLEVLGSELKKKR
jgi:MerR family transcriptional regulator/heat shock protein HspR